MSKQRRLLALATFLLFFGGVYWYRHNLLTAGEYAHISPAHAWKFDLDSRYYVVDATWADKNKYSKFIGASAGDLPLSFTDVKDKLVAKISKDRGPKFTEVEQEVTAQYADEYKKIILEDLRAQMSKDYAALYFMNLVNSYSALDQLRTEYLVQNEDKIRNGIVYDLLKDTSDAKLKAEVDNMPKLVVDRQKYFQHVVDAVIVKNAPKELKISTDQRNEAIGGNMLLETGLVYSRRFLTHKRVKLTPLQFTELQTKHDDVVRAIRTMLVPPLEIYSGDGIVISSAKLTLPAVIGSIVQLRETKSELPVEVILDSEKDYNKQACEEVLPRLNAKCKVLERELGAETLQKLKLKGFQLKMLAILMSLFDNTIVLDADNWVAKNPDFLLTSQPYLETKFLLWPDAWHKGTSPLYYDIARFEVGEPVRRDGFPNDKPFSLYVSKNIDTEVFFHDLAGVPSFKGTESGQLVISKREHFRSLILLAYYNFYGPDFYYPLLYQGTYGSGDRETFVPALHVMNEPYYMCDYEMTFVGVKRKYVEKEGTYMDESTMVQRDPQQARRYMSAWKRWLKSEKLDTRLNPFQEGDHTKELRKKFHESETDVEMPEPLFLHVHDPKFNALYNEVLKKTRFDYKTRYIRAMGEFDDILGKTDWELRFHIINMWVTCHGLTDPELWQSFKVDQQATCTKMQELVDILKADTNDARAGTVTVLQQFGYPATN